MKKYSKKLNKKSDKFFTGAEIVFEPRVEAILKLFSEFKITKKQISSYLDKSINLIDDIDIQKLKRAYSILYAGGTFPPTKLALELYSSECFENSRPSHQTLDKNKKTLIDRYYLNKMSGVITFNQWSIRAEPLIDRSYDCRQCNDTGGWEEVDLTNPENTIVIYCPICRPEQAKTQK